MTLPDVARTYPLNNPKLAVGLFDKYMRMYVREEYEKTTVCSLPPYFLDTFKVISEQVPTCVGLISHSLTCSQSFILLPLWDPMPPVPWPDILHNHISLILREPDLVLS